MKPKSSKSKKPAEQVVKNIRRRMRRHFSAEDKIRIVLEHVAQSYRDYSRLVAHFDWIAPSLIMHVDYSELVDGVIRNVLNYLGVDWEAKVLEFHQRKRVVRTPSNEQERRPLNQDGMKVWQPYSEWLGPLRRALGDLA